MNTKKKSVKSAKKSASSKKGLPALKKKNNKEAFPPKYKVSSRQSSKTRYSDDELGEFKGIILKKLDEAKRDYNLLIGQISYADEHGTDDTAPSFKMLEDGSDVLSKEELSQLAGRQQKFIRNLENALVRIENKTYGICRATGKLIEKERLKAVPHATLSYEAKMQRR